MKDGNEIVAMAKWSMKRTGVSDCRDREDVLQALCLKAMQAQRTYKTGLGASESTYLFNSLLKSARTVAFLTRRRRRFRRGERTILFSEVGKDFHLAKSPPFARDYPLPDLDAVGVADGLLRSIDSRHQKVLRMKASGMSNKDIGRELGVSGARARVILDRAKMKLYEKAFQHPYFRLDPEPEPHADH